jgi:uncharacterized protein with von Willebrand factor type A (vWA) domain
VSLVDRHLAFVDALRVAGLPVSLAEGLDAVHAVQRLGVGDRETLRAAYAATLVKRQGHRPGFDTVFDLYFPRAIGEGRGAPLLLEEGESASVVEEGESASVVEEGEERARLETTRSCGFETLADARSSTTETAAELHACSSPQSCPQLWTTFRGQASAVALAAQSSSAIASTAPVTLH